jgi:hypothetical protein
LDVEHLQGALSTQLDLLFSPPSSPSSSSPHINPRFSINRSIDSASQSEDTEINLLLRTTTATSTTTTNVVMPDDEASDSQNRPKCIGTLILLIFQLVCIVSLFFKPILRF